MFGGPATPAPTPSLFGAPPATGGGLFGAAQPTQQQQGSTPSLFGAAKPSTAPSPFGALGGATATPSPFGGGTSLFGGPAATPAPAGGSLFGATPTQTAANPFQLGASGGLGFGTATSAPAPTMSFAGLGGFGATSAAPAGGSSLFGGGQAAGGSLFGAPQQQAAAQQPGQQQQGQQQQQQQPTDIFPLFRAQMMLAWDPANARTCAFRTVLFDDASRETPSGAFAPPPPDELSRLRSAARAAADDLLWDHADARNPDPSRLVPVQLSGFHALKARCDAQCAEERMQAAKLAQLSAQLAELTDRRDVEMRVKLGAYGARHAALSHRLLALVGKVELLRERRKQQHQSAAAALGGGGYGSRGALAAAAAERSLSELQLHAQFADLQADIVHGKALRARLHAVHARAAQLAGGEEGEARLSAAPALPHATVARLSAVLGQQQAAIAQLRAVLEKDERDLAILAKGLAGGGGPAEQPRPYYY